jgi:DNA polymerase
MDARERLRRYLEQRRELGESELVLDGMPVEDVMALLGARGAAGVRAPRAAERPVDRAEAAGDERREPAEATPPQPAEAPRVAEPPPEPATRFDPTASTDWRETLRRAGAMRPGAAEPANAPQGTPSPRVEPPVGAARPEAQPSLIGDETAPGPVPAWLDALGVPLGISAGAAPTRVLSAEIASLPTLEAIADATRACTRCDLYRTATNAVPGEGNPDADFVCVGEAPGQNEDEQGRPFVGAAGQLLNKILGAIGLAREEVFICNVLKHRPPGNRDPLPEEVRACEPYLRRQLELVKPRVILALGRFAAQSLLQTTTPIGKLRGQVHRYHGIPLIVTYHPAALLRNEAWKRPTWEDVKVARRILDASRAAANDSAR